MKSKHFLKISFALVMFITFFNATAQQGTAINTSGAAADASAILDVSSTTQGLLIPRMTETDRVNIASPATGLLIYQTDVAKGFYYFTGAAWTYIGADNLGNHTATDSLDMANYKIKNLTTCTANLDAANKWYVDSKVAAGGGGTSGGGGATGCAGCISELSYKINNGNTLTWIACADSCHNLVYNGKDDWRMPTGDEMIFYRSVFDTPADGWISGYVWGSGPLFPESNRSTIAVFNESAGTWSSANDYNGYGPHRCRCVR